jgi:hypothetical protein
MGISTFSQQTVNSGFSDPVGSGNVIINGGFDVWQRGTSPTWVSNNTTNFGPDRWYAISPAGRTHSRVSSGLVGFQYAVRYQRTAGNTDTLAINAGQILETINSIPLAGKQVTLSFYARRGADYSGGTLLGAVNSGTGTDQNYVFPGFSGGAIVAAQSFTLTTNWQRFTVTGTVSSSATQLSVRIESGAFSGTAGANDWFELTGVQLEDGGVATPFRRNAPSIAAELAACQRYYEKSYNMAITPGSSANPGSFYQSISSDQFGNATLRITFQQTKRVVPSMSFFTNPGTSGGWNFVRSGVGDTFTAGSWTADWAGTHGGMAFFAVGASFATCTLSGQWAASAEL